MCMSAAILKLADQSVVNDRLRKTGRVKAPFQVCPGL